MEDDEPPPQKEDVSLPRATVSKLLDDMLPSDVRLSSEVRELFAECCTEFINLVSSEANEVADKESKKTIGPEHVLTALEHLGFEGMLREVAEAGKTFKEEQKEGNKQLKRARSAGEQLSEEEAIRQQEALFAAARAKCYAQPPPADPAP